MNEEFEEDDGRAVAVVVEFVVFNDESSLVILSIGSSLLVVFTKILLFWNIASVVGATADAALAATMGTSGMLVERSLVVVVVVIESLYLEEEATLFIFVKKLALNPCGEFFELFDILKLLIREKERERKEKKLYFVYNLFLFL